MATWDVYRNGRLYETIEYTEEMTAEGVRRDLIDNEDFPHETAVLEARAARGGGIGRGRQRGAATKKRRRR